MPHWQVLALPIATVLAACGSSPAPPAKTSSAAPTRTTEPQSRPVAVDPPGEGEKPPDAAVKATFETSAAEFSAGSTFVIAVHFRIADQYRLSWTNPGDMGKEIAVEFQAPDGFEVSTPMFPGPRRFTLPDNRVSYGYAAETAVFAEVRAPANVVEGEVYRFEVSAEWLACRGTCLKEAMTAYFELVAAQELYDQGFSGQLPAIYASVPRPIGKLDDVSFEWRTAGQLAVIGTGVEWKDYFPAHIDQPIPRGMSMNASAGELLLDFERDALQTAVQGVLLAEVDGQPLYVALDAPLP